MVEIPMQNGGQSQLGQFLQFHANRPGREVQRFGVAHQDGNRCAFQRNRESTAQLGQINVQAMRCADHREAGQPAFGGFGLEDRAQAHCGVEFKWSVGAGSTPLAAGLPLRKRQNRLKHPLD